MSENETQPKCFLFRILKGIHFAHEDFQATKIGHNPSWVWTSLLEGRNSFSRFCSDKFTMALPLGLGMINWILSIPSFSPSTSYRMLRYLAKRVHQQTRTWMIDKFNLLFSPTEVATIRYISIGHS